MADATQYKHTVAWRTLASKVVQVTKADGLTLAVYRVYVSALDAHEVGSGQVQTGYYFISYTGNPYLIVAVGSGYIDVEDSFKFRKCPTSGKIGIVYKSVGDGDSPYLAPYFKFLHPNAFEKFMGIALDILWKNGGGGSPQINGLGMSADVIGDMGLPSEVNSTTENTLTDHSHTHKLGDIGLDNIKESGGYGALYNFYAAIDSRKITSSDDWVVPTKTQWDDLSTFLGGTSVAGGKLKDTGLTYWNSPNTNATNVYGFNAKGAGYRVGGSGSFTLIKEYTGWFSSTLDGLSQVYTYNTGFDIESLDASSEDFIPAFSIRLCNPSTLLSEGQTGSYTDNSGQTYGTIVINGVEWMTENLNETQYRTGAYIHGYEGGVYTHISDADWAILETEGMCYYNGIESYGSGGVELSSVISNLQTQINNIPPQVGDNTYIGLDDTSDTTFTGKDKNVPLVNEETGKLDLTETILAVLTLMGDFPSSYSGAALKALRVNSGATAVEFYDALAAFIQNQQVSAQATSNFWISGKARAGTGHFGGATDYSEFEADGTLKFNGAATVHDDLTGDITRTKTVGSRVTLDDTENTIDFTSSGTLSDYLFLNYQNKHAWKAGSDIKPHIHFEQASNAVPNFLIEYRWQRQGQSKTTAWSRIICNTLAISYTSGTINNIAYSAAITPPSGYSLSDIIQIRIIRDTANTSGLFSGTDGYSGTVKVTAVDAHIECDSMGSRTEYAK